MPARRGQLKRPTRSSLGRSCSWFAVGDVRLRLCVCVADRRDLLTRFGKGRAEASPNPEGGRRHPPLLLLVHPFPRGKGYPGSHVEAARPQVSLSWALACIQFKTSISPVRGDGTLAGLESGV